MRIRKGKKMVEDFDEVMVIYEHIGKLLREGKESI